ncbi:MAG: T9SS type A sorting domain-containing protein, partial [Bacteroidota bacterium]
ANGAITLNRQSQGYTGSYEGHVTASGAISIDRRNRIIGDVTAGSVLTVHPSATVTGTASGNAAVSPIALPGVVSVTPGMQNVTVTTSSQTLTPGAYRRVRVESNSGLTLTAGTYDLDRLQLRPFTTLTLDVSGGPITIQTATQLAIARDVILKVTGASGPDNGLSHLVTMRTAQTTDVSIGNRSFVAGTIEAPLAKVRIRADASYIGRLAAREIRVDNRTTLWRHGAAPSVVPPAPPVASLSAPEADGSSEALALTVGPNPLRGVAEIAFSLEAAAPVRLAVYDALGREVAVLADGPLAAGAHRAAFDATDLPAGVYVLRLSTPTEATTARVTRVR